MKFIKISSLENFHLLVPAKGLYKTLQCTFYTQTLTFWEVHVRFTEDDDFVKHVMNAMIKAAQ